MRRRFRWTHSDILYTRQEEKSYSIYPLSVTSRRKLLSLEVNLGDQMLYETFRHFWWKQPDTESEDFWDEVCMSSLLV